MKRALGGELLGENLPIPRHLAEFQCPLNLDQQIIELDRLEQVVPRPRAHGGDGAVHRAVGGDHDDRGLRRDFDQMIKQGHTVHLRHANVGQHHVHGLLDHEFVGFPAVFGLMNFIALLLQQIGKRFSEYLFVFCDEDLLGHVFLNDGEGVF